MSWRSSTARCSICGTMRAYLSTVFADVSFDQARRDMSRLIGEWLSEGFAMIPRLRFLVLAEAGYISLPFDIDAEVSRPSFAAEAAAFMRERLANQRRNTSSIIEMRL